MDDERISLPEEAEPATAAPGIGETLRTAREQRGVTLEQASELLRIEPRFLVALEDERFDAIGAPVFVRGYLKHYCELLGVDARPLLDALRERLAGGEPELKGRRPVADEDKPAAAMPFAIGAAVVVVAAAIAWWQLGGAPEDAASERSARAVTDVRDESAPDAAVAGPGPDRGDHRAEAASSRADAAPNGLTSETGAASRPNPAGSGTGPAASESSLAEPGSAVVEPVSADVEPGADSAASPDPAESGSGLPDEVTAAAVSRSDGERTAALEIELRFTEDSWTEITAAGGERLFYGLASAGREERILADGEVSVRLGNAGGVSIQVNGEPFAYPPGSRRGSLAVFRLSPPED